MENIIDKRTISENVEAMNQESLQKVTGGVKSEVNTPPVYNSPDGNMILPQDDLIDISTPDIMGD